MPVTRVLAYLIVLFVAIVATENAMLGLAIALGIKSSLGQMLVVEIWHMFVSVSLLYLFLRFVEKTNLIDSGITSKKMLPELLIGCAVGTLLVIIIVTLMFLAQVYVPIKINSAQDLLMSAFVLFFAACTEEIIFRAYAFRITERAWGTIAALIFSSLIFGFAHMLNEVGGAPVMEKVVSCAFLALEAGLPLAACFVFTKRLWMPIGAHWMWNFFEGPVLGTHVSGADFGNSLLTAKMVGPDLLTGGKFGPEGSVICLAVGTLFGVILIFMSIRKKYWLTFIEAKKLQLTEKLR
ncbi:MAG: CPBP family intramembrane metalloprotease [Leptolyngbya sp.]|nr:CPBP family intramembrane metalloprotease [Candidatus Melainabacteria bacterium]